MPDHRDATLEDNFLVNQLRESDAEAACMAFEELYRRHYIPAVRFAYRFVTSRAIAEDITQDVFFALWDRRSTLSIQGNLRTYILSAVRFEALDVLRRDRVSSHIADDQAMRATLSATLEHYATPPDTIIEETMLQERMQRVIQVLPERQRTALLLRWEQDLNNNEIAAVLGIGKAAVSRLLTRAVETIRTLVFPAG